MMNETENGVTKMKTQVDGKSVGMTVSQMKVEVVAKNAELKDLVLATRNVRAHLRFLRQDIRREKMINKIVREDHLKAKKAARLAKSTARREAMIAKTEARLAALKDKQNSPKARRLAGSKAGPVTTLSPEQIAAFEQTRAVSA